MEQKANKISSSNSQENTLEIQNQELRSQLRQLQLEKVITTEQTFRAETISALESLIVMLSQLSQKITNLESQNKKLGEAINQIGLILSNSEETEEVLEEPKIAPKPLPKAVKRTIQEEMVEETELPALEESEDEFEDEEEDFEEIPKSKKKPAFS